MNRSEHIAWCKERALREKDPTAAWQSMCSDLQKHDETKEHPAIELGMMLMMAGHLSSVDEMRKFIQGFN